MTEYHAYDPMGHIKAISLLLKNASNFTAEKSDVLKTTDYSAYGELGEMMYGEDVYTTVYCDAAYSHLVASSLATFFGSSAECVGN
ncbi:hypothetical protein [Geomesophilobacter sediminis]|uniref:Uncharacterized protein n=1 Tax=Geomesophilobacter sediminis TaxID=2798584 RepID=A0A8J7M2N1_9BACT|nr:hypothetical protein [Geomesophilobacter sediminis]MBJ6727512.1 hypothetical protein [Geomesophilobacter sediminis]